MKALILLCSLALATTWVRAGADEDAAPVSQTAIRELGTLNGQALACRQFALAADAKTLMIRHAPKTPGFGALFEGATNAAFIEQTKGSVPCPSADAQTDLLKEIESRLQAVLPADPASAPAPGPGS